MNFLDDVEGWLKVCVPSDIVKLEFTRNPVRGIKDSATVTGEYHSRLGSMTVWESGEFEAEVFDTLIGSRTYVMSGLVGDARELRRQLNTYAVALENGRSTTGG